MPLFGDPRTTPVTHPLWARLLLRALDLNAAVRASAQASQVFTTLAWRDSLAYRADRFFSARDALVRTQAGVALVTAGPIPAEVTYAVAVVQSGHYQLRAQLAGEPELRATAEIVPLEGGAALEAFTLPLPGARGWVFAGWARLAPGSYGVRFLLPPGCTLARVEIAPPCLNPIEPPGGWLPDAVTTRADLAVSALRAMDREDELPPAASPVELEGDAFRVEAPLALAAASARAGLEAMTLRAGHGGLRAVAPIDLPEAGLYVVSALIAPGAGQRWIVDGCRSAGVCPGGHLSGWRTILSQAFSAGRHSIEVTLGDGASVQAVRLERKKSRPADYVAALEGMGFRAGPEGPVSRATALDAARFVREQRRAALASECVQPLPVEETPLPPAARLTATGPEVPKVPVIPEAPPPVPPPIESPILPPQEVATPTRPGGGT